MNASISSIAAQLADSLGDTQAQIADLRAHESEIKNALIQQGVSPVEGAYFRVTVSRVAGRKSVDWEAIARRFGPSRQLIAAHTTAGKPSFRVACKARKTTSN